MPRYHFDIVFGGDGRITDHEGIELRDAAVAHEIALIELRNLLSAQMARVLDPTDCGIEVLNADRRLLFTVPCADAYSTAALDISKRPDGNGRKG